MAGKGESNCLGKKHPTWAKIANAYLDPEWSDNGVQLQNPNDHAEATDVGERENTELDRHREVLAIVSSRVIYQGSFVFL